jgi:hypothetical protein
LQQYYADQYNTKFFKEGALISGIWKPQGPRPLSPATEKELNDRLKVSTNQGLANAHKAPVIQGVDWQPVGVLQKDMQFIEQKRMTKEEILEVFKVPKAILGLADTTYNNMAAAQKGLYTEKVIPDAKHIEAAFLTQFFMRVAPQYYLEFNFSAIPYLQEDLKAKADTAFIFYNMGFSLEQINEKLNLGFEFAETPVPPTPEPTPQEPAPTKREKILEELKNKAINNTRMLPYEINARRFDQDKAAQVMVSAEKLITKKLKSYWKNNFTEVISYIKENKTQKDFGSLLDGLLKFIAGKRFAETMGPTIQSDIANIHWQGIRKGYNMLGAVAPKAPEKLRAWVNNRLLRLSDSGKEMQEAILDSIKKNKTVDELVDTLKYKFNVAENRATTIARTESTAGYNAGRTVAIKDLGAKKQWSHSHDDRVRESHRISETVNADELFTLGSGVKVLWPGDGPPEEACNCRCTVIPIILDTD